MSARLDDGGLPAEARAWPFGIAPIVHDKLVRLFEAAPGIERVWIFGSRARGDHRPASDIDLAVDMPNGSDRGFAALAGAIEDLELIYRTDVLHWQAVADAGLRACIERDRRLFWAPRARAGG